MLVELRDREQLQAILRDVEARFAALPLFRAGRRGIMEGYAQHAANICASLTRLGWIDGSWHDVSKASVILDRLASSFWAILRTTAATRPGIGKPPADAVWVAADIAFRYVIVTRVLRYMRKSGAWGLASYDADTRELLLARQDDEIQARESFNSVRLLLERELRLRATMAQGLSPDISPHDVHLNEVRRLNPAYTQRVFHAVMRVLQARAIWGGDLCQIMETDRLSLEEDIADRSGAEPDDVSAVIGDLLFTFDPKQDGEELLIEVEPGRVALVPLLMVERSHFASDYVSISKARYPTEYGAYHKALTRTLEDQVGVALRGHVPHAEVHPLKLPGVHAGVEGGQVDQVAADPAEDALLLVEVKYTFDHDNDLIADGVRQLQRDESIMRERWAEVSRELRGWKGRGFPKHVGKLLVTKWFLGTEPVPKDIRVLSLNDLQRMPLGGSLRAVIERIAALPEPRLVPKYEHRLRLFGYTFIHYLSLPDPNGHAEPR